MMKSKINKTSINVKAELSYPRDFAGSAHLLYERSIDGQPAKALLDLKFLHNFTPM